MDINFSTVWLAISSPIRLAILSFLFLFLFRRILVYLLKKAGICLLWLLQGMFFTLFFIGEKVLIMLFKVFGKLLNPINHLFEELRSKILKGMPNMYKRWRTLWKNDSLVNKYSKFATFIFPIVLALTTYQWPDSKVSTLWYKNEEKVLSEQLHVKPIQSIEARALLINWMDSWFDGGISVGGEHIKMKLKEGYDGGNIRENASKAANVVTAIASQETVEYLEEEAVDNRGVTWYKVKTQSGEIGWVSSSIIERY